MRKPGTDIVLGMSDLQPMIRPLAALVVALLASGATAVASPRHAGHTQNHTPAGNLLARSVLIRRSDVGRDWRQESPAPAKVPSLTCPQFNPPVSGVKEIGAAASPTFQASAYGPFVSEIAHTYATPSEGTAVWRAISRPGLLVCAVDSLRRSGGPGVRFAVTGRRLLPLPSLPAPAVGYRVTGTAAISYQTLDVYLDMLVVGRGQTIAAIVLSSFEQPPARRMELRLAGMVARRVARPRT